MKKNYPQIINTIRIRSSIDFDIYEDELNTLEIPSQVPNTCNVGRMHRETLQRHLILTLGLALPVNGNITTSGVNQHPWLTQCK